jgi:type IV pilus assembly protein PilM
MSFLNTSSYPIGLDISDLSIKLVQLKKRGDKIKIQAWGKICLPPGLLENGEIKNKEKLAAAIKKLVRYPDFGRVNSSEAIICLPEGKTFLKIIEIEKEIIDKKKAIESELQKHVPLPIESLDYDWQTIGDSSRSNLILVGAAPKNIINEHISLLQEANFSAAAIETEPVSICRCLLEEENPKYKTGNKKNYAIINVGAIDSSLTVYSKNTILFSVNLPVSGEKITTQISQMLEIDREQAEKIKILYGLNENNDQPAVKKIIQELISDLTARSQDAVNFFNHHFSSWGPIEKIFICGGEANIKNLEKNIREKTGIETSRGNVFANLNENKTNSFANFRKTFGLNNDFVPEEKTKNKQSKTIKVSHDTSLSYATAIGLALRGIFIDE